MPSALKRLRDDLFGDDLFFRVTIFIMGAIVTAVPVLALVSGVAFTANDSAFYILLALMAILGLFLLLAALRGGDKLLDKAFVWGIPADLVFVIGLLTLAAPITIAIKHLRRSSNE